ncbi:hypothetical protein PILCRDRAFT_7050 [Piloderma croceum F 1598]|uniref:Uncharacterized protein n=1 Tax=Piloderma croceum (strain F 1598) TaxID=765440 RepID=A0A0C3FZK4_PILCF|nr:hypothetical protein PILCRDRAFT_7050 [Piloderma croceum F 1598]
MPDAVHVLIIIMQKRDRQIQKARTASASPKKNKTAATDVTSDATSDDPDDYRPVVQVRKDYKIVRKLREEWKRVEKWTKEGREGLEEEQETGEVPEERSLFAGAFDNIGAQTPTALRLLTAYKCDHLDRQFEMAEGLRSAFKLYWERVHGLKGEFWRNNRFTKEWEGNPVFDGEYQAYFELLKNRDKRTSMSTQALPMLPQDLKVIMAYLDSDEARENMSETKRLYF